MARYIKANSLVAKYLQLENDRNTLGDGNYLFWQSDMLAFGPLTQLNDTLAKIGGIALMPHEAREEQDGTVCRSLPMATDARFQKVANTTTDNAAVDGTTETNTDAEQSAEGESEANGEEETDADSDTESGANEKSNE